MFLERRNRRLRKKSNRRILMGFFNMFFKISVITLLVVFLWSAYTFVLTSPYFVLKKIEITGTKHISSEEFEDFLGIPPNTNIFTVDLNALRQKAESHEWVSSAVVTRILPDSILVEIVEHIPVALLGLSKGLYLVDKRGEVFRKVEKEEEVDFPVITGLSDIQENSPELKDAIKFLQLFEGIDRDFYRLISELHFDNFGRINVFTTSLRMQLILDPKRIKSGLVRFMEVKRWAERMLLQPIYIEVISDERAVARFIRVNNTSVRKHETRRAEGKKAGEING